MRVHESRWVTYKFGAKGTGIHVSPGKHASPGIQVLWGYMYHREKMYPPGIHVPPGVRVSLGDNCFRFACPAEAFWRLGGMEARRFGVLEAWKPGGMEAWSLDVWMHGSMELRA